MAAMHINSDKFEETVIKSDKPVLVDFFAEWCGPCKMAAPVLDKLADEYKDKALIVKVDVDQNQELAQQHGVMSIPTVVLFDGGEEKDRKIGFGGEQGYRDMLDK
ncbi:thioredoxin [Patescibacteria group bacterium]